jgi:ectoine hydroxylase-related dioxygenase (phytanoyl-CoA dioxygenase family)
VFHWHQDLAYWPVTPDPRTASFWLALDDTDLDNGCLSFVAGSHREPRLRPHLPLHGDREQSHTLV